MCYRLKTFCCFISLEVGAQIISIISTLLSTIITVLYASAAIFLQLSHTKLIFYSAMAIAAGFQCISAGFLSYGAFQRRPKYMWPWLAVVWVTGAGLLLTSIAGTTLLILGGQLSSDVNVVIFSYVFYSSFLLYCALVVNSRRVELNKEQEYIETAETLMRNHHSWKYC